VIAGLTYSWSSLNRGRHVDAATGVVTFVDAGQA